MARGRSRTQEPEYGLANSAYELDHASTLVRAGIEEAAGALVDVTGAHVWERAVQGREVGMRPRAYFVYQMTDHDWSVIVPRNTLRWNQAEEAVELSRQLRTRVITYAGSDSAGCYGYDLYENGERVEHWYLGEEEEEFESLIRPEGYWDVADGIYEYLDAFFREQKAYEPGWRFVDFLGARKSQQFETGESWLVADCEDDYVERVDWIAAPERKKRRPANEPHAES